MSMHGGSRSLDRDAAVRELVLAAEQRIADAETALVELAGARDLLDQLRDAVAEVQADKQEQRTGRPDLLTVDDAGWALSVSAVTVRRLISRGELHAVKIGSNVRVPAVGSLWDRKIPHGGLVFATVRGGPIARKSDWNDWKDLLAEARVAHRRVHDARVTAATLALEMGLTEQTVMMMFGWSQRSMLTRYQKFVTPVARQAADSMDAALFTSAKSARNGKRQTGC